MNSNSQYSFFHEKPMPAQDALASAIIQANAATNASPFFITLLEVRDSSGVAREYRVNLAALALIFGGAYVLLRLSERP